MKHGSFYGSWAGRDNLVGDRRSSINGAITLGLKLNAEGT